tara:strand:- start:5991 stop:6410 length:420 start_codon:yes stop_codon:yes gene_type:complete
MKTFTSTSSTPSSPLKGGTVKNTHRQWLSIAIGVLVGNLIFMGIVALIMWQTNFERLIFEPIGKSVAKGMEPIMNKALSRASKSAIADAKVAAYNTVDTVQDQAIEGTSQRVIDAVNNTREDIVNDAREATSSYLDQYR